MPWTVQDVDKHKKGLTDKQKELWVRVANSVLERCQKEGGQDCEASAIRQANSVVEKNMSYDDWVKEYKIQQTFNLHGVEIFAAGTWNGDTYTEKDLDEMVTAFKEVGFEPPLKLGHQEKDGQPAFGWIDRIYRQGKKLLADFKELPQKVYEALKRGNYKRVSAEIYWNYRKGEKVFPRVLKAVALLGGDIPAVTDLEAIGNLYHDNVNTDVRIYAEWDTAFINDLPDAAFAIILPGGEKDDEGKTTPRALRKLPHHNASVKNATENESVDKPHLRNALARLPQTNLTTEQKRKALSHLQAHARALEIGEAAEMTENQIEKEEKQMEDKMKQLQQELDNLKKEKEALEAKFTDTEKAKEELEAKHEEIKKAKTELEKAKKEAETKLAEQQAKVKAEHIKNFIAEQKKAGKILPKFEKELEALLNSATDQKVYAYKDDDEKEVNLSQLELVERIVTALPKMVEFAELGEEGEDIDLLGDYEHDPGVEVDRRAKLYLDKEKAKTYEEAFELVLEKDPELKKAYLGGV